MNSVTSFLRRRGYAIREIERLLQDLKPTTGYWALELGGSGMVREIMDELKEEPMITSLASSRCSLAEAGLTPVTEHGHTLRVPLSSKPGAGQLCFTRIAQDRWLYFVDQQTFQGRGGDEFFSLPIGVP
jgi:hypothetical protein